MNHISPISAIAPETPQRVQTPPRNSHEQSFDAGVSAAVRSLNEAGYAGTGLQISLSFDPATRRPVIEVVDKETQKVLLQWPSAYVLELAREESKRAAE